MNAIPLSTILQRGLSLEVAQYHIRSFEEQFGQAHLYLAYHAAFPLVLTPDLLYGLWANFPRDSHHEPLNIPWIAVADLLLSDLCEEVGYELYEINVTVRNTLLRELKADPNFGEQRINELSNFLLVYIEQQLGSSDPGVRNLAMAQHWTALAFTQPEKVARELASMLRLSMAQQNGVQQLRIASLIETFAEPLAEFAPLLTYARGVAHLVHKDLEDAKIQFASVEKIEQMWSGPGIYLPIPEQIDRLLYREPDFSESPQEDVVFTPITPLPQTPLDYPHVDSGILPPKPILEPLKRERLYTNCICPSCFEEIYLGDCRIVSGVTPGKVLKEAPKRGWTRRMARLNPEPLDSHQYIEEAACRECPECGYLLPSNIEHVPSITLAVVGDTYSGKSLYTAALLRQLEDWVTHTGGSIKLTCLTPGIEERYKREYIEPLFIYKQILPATQLSTRTTMEPLIYELSVHLLSEQQPKSFNLIIYDVAGEEFRQAHRLVEYARFVFEANAFIFVADPVMMAPILTQLPFSLQEKLSALFLTKIKRAVEVLNTTLSVFERYHAYPEGTSLSDIPIAVMVSKSDLLEHLNLPPDCRFLKRTQYGNTVNLQDIDVVDQEVRVLLRTYKQGDLMATTSRFKRVKFFATSATGEPPDSNGYFKNVNPCRCLDPILWILHQKGVISAML